MTRKPISRLAVAAPLALMLVLAGAALAHTGTKNPRVKAWMDNMTAIQKETKILGSMARGKADFDRARANLALDRIAAHSARVPSLFEVRADDPTSEARDRIWTDWDAYRAEARRLTRIAETTEIAGPETLRPALAAIGGTCKSCHGTYRE